MSQCMLKENVEDNDYARFDHCYRERLLIDRHQSNECVK